MWQLWLDDDRYPGLVTIAAGWNWKLARNVDDAMWMIRTYGLPNFMSLDHDLGPDRMTGMDFCKQFTSYLMDNSINWPKDLGVYIHSQNPVGAKNMQSYLDNFKDQYAA